MLSPTTFPSRFLPKARQAYLRRLVRIGAVGGMIALPAACGTSDADTFAATTTAAVEATAASTEAAANSASADTTLAPAATAAATTEAPASAQSAAAAGELVVEFTYQPDGGQRANNPYIAVWVEDADGNLVDTISVWHKSGNDRWLSDLRAWYGATGGSADSSATGATRSAGSYAVAWDGTDIDGNPVAAGEYVIFVESAREHGPYQITSATITIGDTGSSAALPDDGELSGITAAWTV